MKIAILTDSFSPYISGVTTYSIELGRALLRKGHELLIFAPDYGQNPEPKGLEGAKIVRLPSFQTHIPGLRICLPNTRKVLLIIRRFRADVIEIEGPSILGVEGLIASKVLDIPCVAHFHTLLTSDEYLQLIFKTQNRLLTYISWKYNRWFYNSSDMVFVWTNQIAELLISNRFNPQNIQVISPIIDCDNVKMLLEDEVKEIKEKYNLKENVAVYLGRVSSEKRLDFLMHVWSQVVAECQESSLLIIGDGLFTNALRNIIDLYSLNDHVQMVGSIDHEDLLSTGILSACDLFVSASTSETFGFSGLEAMAHGIPVVLARSQGLAEIVSGAGIVCSPNSLGDFAESILLIFRNKELKSKLGRNGIRIAKCHSSDAVVDEILEQYRSLHTRNSTVRQQ
jgi:glycosyltransferase involved in cell wall biosynthesis